MSGRLRKPFLKRYEIEIARGGRRYTGNLGIAGAWPPVNPAPEHDTLHEDEAHHQLEPAYAR